MDNQRIQMDKNHVSAHQLRHLHAQADLHATIHAGNFATEATTAVVGKPQKYDLYHI